MVWLRQKFGPKSGYYYRHVRINGRPVKLYVGRGVAADMAVLLDERKREDKKAAHDARYEEQFRIALADIAADEARRLTKLLATATLIVAGYYDHHGSWRRRRNHGKPRQPAQGSQGNQAGLQRQPTGKPASTIDGETRPRPESEQTHDSEAAP